MGNPQQFPNPQPLAVPQPLIFGSRTFDFSRDIAIVGIVNVTPDSFTDGGRFASPDDAAEWAFQLIEEGADILDIGGESSRPGAVPIAAHDEAARVVPVIRAIRRGHPQIPLSIDTTKAAVAQAALDAGANCVNDISAGSDPAMFPLAKQYQAPMVLMHRQGTSAIMQQAPAYVDVVAEVRRFLADRIAAAEQAGIVRERLIVDPGIGFGKTVEHNLVLLRRLTDFQSLGCPLLIGTSRKWFIGQLLGGAGITERLEGSLATLAVAWHNGARLFRVHDVAATKRYLTTYRCFFPSGSL